MDRRIVLFGGVAAVIGLTAASLIYIKWWNVDHSLSSRPSRSATTAALPSSPSEISATAVIPYATLQAALNDNAPVSYNGQGRDNVCVDINETVQKTIENAVGGDVGKVFGGVARIITTVVTVNQLRRVCQDVDYSYSIARAGPVTVGPIQEAIRITVPIAANGVVGFSGDIAKVVELDRKNFRGSILAIADVKMDMTSEWCPVIAVTPSFVWENKAQLEIAHKFWIDVDASAKSQIDKLLADLASKIPEAVNCAKIRASIGPVMQPRQIALDTTPPDRIYLNISPQNAGFSGLRYDADAIRLALSIKGITEASTSPARLPPAPDLPPLERIDVNSDAINLTLPLRLGYEELGRQLTRALGARTFSSPTRAGQVDVKIAAVEIYPAADKLVVGLRFSARLPNRVLDANGVVYLVAKPILDESRQTLTVEGLSFTRELDNKVWRVVSAVFRDQIQVELQRQARFDLKPAIKTLRAKLEQQTAAIAATPPHLQVKLRNDFVGLQRVVLTANDITILAAFRGGATVTVPVEAVSRK